MNAIAASNGWSKSTNRSRKNGVSEVVDGVEEMPLNNMVQTSIEKEKD